MAEKQLDLLAAGAKASAGTSPEKGGKRGGGKGKGGGGGGDGGGPEGPPEPADASLAEEAQRRYLNYAVSVITARALPDVRDGLKPVQRRILYAMYATCTFTPTPSSASARPSSATCWASTTRTATRRLTRRWCAWRRASRCATRWSTGTATSARVDGDSPAAYRYTEAKLAPLAAELLEEIKQGTVDMRPNYDGTPRSRSCCRPRSRTCWSTAAPASRSAWRPTSRRTTWARSARRRSRSSTTRTADSRIC